MASSEPTDSADTDWEARGINERRLGLLIMENKGGAEMAGAAAHLRNAAEAFAKAERTDRRAECLLQLGRLQAQRELHVEAAEDCVQALRLYRNLGDEADACDAALAASEAWCAAERWDEAERRSGEAVELAKALNDHLRIGATQRGRGRACIGAGALGEAMASLQEAIGIFEQWRKGLDAALTRELLGLALLRKGDAAAARGEYEAAVEALTGLARPFDASQLLARWAEAERRQGDHRQAAAVLERAAAIHREAGHRRQLCEVLRLRGNCLLDGGEADAAIPILAESLEMAEGMSDEALRGRCCYLLGAAHERAGQSDRALPLLDRALELAAANDDLRTQERVLATRVRLHRRAGATAEAQRDTATWLQLLEQLGDRDEEIRALGSLASMQQRTGSLAEAETHLRRLLSLCEEGRHQGERVFAERGLAALAIKRGAHGEALPHLDHAIAHYRQSLTDPNAPRERLQILERLHAQRAGCHVQLGDGPAALADLQTCLELLEKHIPTEARDPNHLAAVLGGIGKALRHLGRNDEAAPYLRRAQEVAEAQGTPRGTMILRRREDDSAARPAVRESPDGA